MPVTVFLPIHLLNSLTFPFENYMEPFLLSSSSQLPSSFNVIAVTRFVCILSTVSSHINRMESAVSSGGEWKKYTYTDYTKLSVLAFIAKVGDFHLVKIL